MKRIITAQLLLALCAVAPSVAGAQGACAEGRTSSGECVNPGLADAMRQAAVIYSQPKLSYTHYPVLPSLDWIFRYPNQLNPDPLKPSPAGTLGGGGGGG
jgi:hypothetical protein